MNAATLSTCLRCRREAKMPECDGPCLCPETGKSVMIQIGQRACPKGKFGNRPSAGTVVLVVDNAAVAGMAQNPLLVEAFPFLATVRDAIGGCCPGKPKYLASLAARRTIATMGATEQSRLRAMLGVARVRVSYPVAGGKPRQVEF